MEGIQKVHEQLASQVDNSSPPLERDIRVVYAYLSTTILDEVLLEISEDKKTIMCKEDPARVIPCPVPSLRRHVKEEIRRSAVLLTSPPTTTPFVSKRYGLILSIEMFPSLKQFRNNGWLILGLLVLLETICAEVWEIHLRHEGKWSAQRCIEALQAEPAEDE